METRTYNVYTFNELSSEAKRKAIASYYECNDFDLIGEYDAECWIDFEAHHVNSLTIGSWSTNPIDCELSDLDLNIDGFLSARLSPRELRQIKHCLYWIDQGDKLDWIFYSKCHVCPWPYRRDYLIQFEPNNRCYDRDRAKRSSKIVQYCCDLLNQHVRDIESEIASNITKEYEYRFTEEYFAELAEANDYRFTEDGKLDW